jgi:peptidoglycan-associated lipoprotein
MLTKVVRMSGVLVSVLSLMVVATGCKGNGSDDVVLQPDVTTTTGPTDGGGNPGDLPEIDINTLFTDAGLQKVYFDYNSFTLRQDAIATLQRNADLIRQVPGVMIQIEGHCDDRGTQEYNLALGEKRALAVREYLISLGIAADHIVTISYGEEVPAAVGTGESVWQQNRRCEFNKAM